MTIQTSGRVAVSVTHRIGSVAPGNEPVPSAPSRPVDTFEPAPSQSPDPIRPPRMSQAEARKLQQTVDRLVQPAVQRAIADERSDAQVIGAARAAITSEVPAKLRDWARVLAGQAGSRAASSQRPGVENQNRFGDTPGSRQGRACDAAQSEPLAGQIKVRSEELRASGVGPVLAYIDAAREVLVAAGYTETDARSAAAAITGR